MFDREVYGEPEVYGESEGCSEGQSRIKKYVIAALALLLVICGLLAIIISVWRPLVTVSTTTKTVYVQAQATIGPDVQAQATAEALARQQRVEAHFQNILVAIQSDTSRIASEQGAIDTFNWSHWLPEWAWNEGDHEAYQQLIDALNTTKQGRLILIAEYNRDRASSEWHIDDPSLPIRLNIDGTPEEM